MSTPLVSIIVPTYNRVRLLGETLDSIGNQTYTNLECLVIDDGSSDGTERMMRAYIERDSRFHYYKRPENRPKGANACRNYGFEQSKGAYVNWFDDDDIMHIDKVSLQVDALEKGNHNFSVCQSLVFEDSLENILGKRSENLSSDNIFKDYLMQKVSWLTQAPIWKREFLQKLDYLFDEELMAAQEWEFHCRVLFNCPDYYVIEETLVFLRQHKESISYNNDIDRRKLHYFLARRKVYSFLRSRKVTNHFLKNYLISHYKYFLKKGWRKLAYEILINHVLFNRDLTFSYRIKLMSAGIIYPVFRRGNLLFKGEPSQF